MKGETHVTPLTFPLALHLSDGVLLAPWVIAGFAVMALLMLPAAFRVRDEEIPRIALLTAAFFVATLLHVPIGPTNVHLLLNGLVGVILGWRAGLAIPVGLTLQALLLGHGGISMVGVNSCIMTLPALLMGGLFHLVRRVPWTSRRLAWLSDFAIGCAIGLLGVLLTLALNALVLYFGGGEKWRAIVAAVVVAHLPLAAVEGIIVGFTLSFLSRVKPELLGTESCRLPGQAPALLLALVSLLLLASPALAHRLDAEYRILDDGRIQVECWYSTDEKPEKATVQVFGPQEKLRTEGQLDAEGKFVFQDDRSEELKVVINAGAGHRKELIIPAVSAAKTAPARSSPLPIKDALTGIGFVLAVASFWIGMRNSRELRELRRILRHSEREIHSTFTSEITETPPPATPPTGPTPG